LQLYLIGTRSIENAECIIVKDIRMRDLLRAQGDRWGIRLSDHQMDQFESYLKLIQLWQERVVRLVGDARAEKLVGEHLGDSLAVYRCIGSWRDKRVIDIGSGAGFPGITLKLIEPALVITLLESSSKKAAFLRKVSVELGLSDVGVVRDRAEDAGQDTEFREQYDIATMRAVASLPRALELGLEFVKVGGSLVLSRGATTPSDFETADTVARRLGGGEVVVRSGQMDGAVIRGSIMTVQKGFGMEEMLPRWRVK